jgi:uncharacterized protein
VRAVFADTGYWIAVLLARDPWRIAADEVRQKLSGVLIVTTDEVLAEFLTAMSRGGEFLRRQTVKMVRTALQDTNVRIVSQSRQTFLDGLKLYEQRFDKEYSLTDCISMNACREHGIKDVLTNDRHFAQEGFRVLLRKEGA